MRTSHALRALVVAAAIGLAALPTGGDLAGMSGHGTPS